jgi:hypothetical protein
LFAFIVIYTFIRLSSGSASDASYFSWCLRCCCSHGYDLLSLLYPDVHALSLAPQYRLWTWLLFYLTGQLFSDPLVASWLTRERVVKGAMIAIPFIYLFTWFYERHFFSPCLRLTEMRSFLPDHKFIFWWWRW